MIHRNAYELESFVVKDPGAKEIKLQRLIDTPDGADRFATQPPKMTRKELEERLIAGALQDEAFKQELQSSPLTALEKEGIDVSVANGQSRIPPHTQQNDRAR